MQLADNAMIDSQPAEIEIASLMFSWTNVALSRNWTRRIIIIKKKTLQNREKSEKQMSNQWKTSTIRTGHMKANRKKKNGQPHSAWPLCWSFIKQDTYQYRASIYLKCIT